MRGGNFVSGFRSISKRRHPTPPSSARLTCRNLYRARAHGPAPPSERPCGIGCGPPNYVGSDPLLT